MNTGIKRALRNIFAQPQRRRRCFARTHALALLIAPLAMVNGAEAACAPASPVNNTTVTCTGTTIDANGTTGYGTNSDTGNTHNILTNASLIGANIGLRFNTLGTVNNSGTISSTGVISGGLFGIQATTTATVNNAGTISYAGKGVARYAW
jgi:hypothetical protein